MASLPSQSLLLLTFFTQAYALVITQSANNDSFYAYKRKKVDAYPTLPSLSYPLSKYQLGNRLGE